MHKSRAPLFALVLLLFCSLLPAAAQVVQPIDPVNPPDGTYSYAVKFVCGFQKGNTGVVNTATAGWTSFGEPTVKAGNYATDVNIYNPNRDTIDVRKSFLLLVDDGLPVGREPRFVEPRAFDGISLPPGTATMDDCNRIAELIPTTNPFALRIGFLVLQSKRPLDVTAVYTAELCSDWQAVGPGRMCSSVVPGTTNPNYSPSLSIDVEQVDGKFNPN